MNTQGEFLRSIAEALVEIEIPFMVTGSLGSTHYGEPRATNDIDIVIAPTADQLDRFVTSFSENYYVSHDAARDALSRRSMFNVIELSSGWKADFIVCKDREFSRTEFSRRQEATILGVAVHIATAEDVILSKLEWAKKSESERQVRDAAGVVLARTGHLDCEYLQRSAKQLGLVDLLNTIMSADE